ncbi:Zinc finger and BTB domain-containing protein 47 [Folsomia candida]|uniref:Zinc finger and BTB domain-containing protein 47 n=1 Tax=Folsomia candida TaxID=158441 RepID=A0A226F075_FOLCA|nr:Zinc finger and BTB domain-containing protein 47 [Folsomia candida]
MSNTSMIEFMSQQFPAMYKTSATTTTTTEGGAGPGGQKVVCTPEVSLYQYNSPTDNASPNNSGLSRLEDKGHPDLGLLPITPPGTSRASEPGSGESVTGSTSSTSGFQCGFCGKTFQQKNTFQNHLRSHREGEDPYQCDICGKTFAVPARLTRQYRTHTGEKP